MTRRRTRWVAGVLGFLSPSLWLAATVLLYAWLPGFRGSGVAFCVSLVLAVALTATATLTARASWSRRLLHLVCVEALLLVQVAVLLGWAYFSMSFGTTQQKVDSAAEWMKPLKWQWGTQSPGKPYSIRSASAVARLGEPSLRFELREGEQYADLFGKTSFRSEVNARDFPPTGCVRWYSFSLLLPADFPIEDTRLVLAQWHGADKKYLGEPARSPSMAFRYSGGRFFITMRHSADRIVRHNAAPSRTLFETAEFARGAWHDFLVQARWSYQDDGIVNVWLNGRQIVQYAGPVGYNDDWGPYFKFGLYRDDSARTFVAYFNHVMIGDSSADVGFDDWPVRDPGMH